MSLETVTHISDLNAANPTSSDPKAQGDDHIRNLKTALLNDFAGFTGAVLVTGTDGGSANTYTVTPSHAVPAYASRMIVIFSPTADNTGAATINISGLGAKSIKTVSGAALTSGDLVTGAIYAASYDGTDFRLLSITKNYVDQLSFLSALPAQALGLLLSDGTNASFSKTLTGFALNTVRATVASHATTADIWAAAGNEIDFTGTATVTDFPDAPVAGASRILHCAGACTFTNNANISVQGAANFTAAAGDIVTVHAITTSTFRISIEKANGQPVVSGLTLIATLTPTAAANLDALNTFTSGYDNYLIIGQGILPAADDFLQMRFANAGSVDAGSNYYLGVNESSTAVTSASTFVSLASGTTVLAAGKGIDFVVHVINANDATNIKAVMGKATWQSAGTPGFIMAGRHAAYNAANAVSGVRFLWNSASNFAAVGKIRIYGYNNT